MRAALAVAAPALAPPAAAQPTGADVLRGAVQTLNRSHGPDEPEAKEMLAAVQLFSAVVSGGETDLPMTVEDVVVNGGRPQWLDEQ